jgi:hypothetical protein
LAWIVVFGRNASVHVFPAFDETDHPKFDAPQLYERPDWNTLTIVEPKEVVTGSTWVRWYVPGFVYGSSLTTTRLGPV